MRIADVAEFYAEAGGGVKTYVDAKLQIGAALGHQVSVIAPGREDRVEERNGGRVFWVRSPPVPGDPRYGLFVRREGVHRALNTIEPDVVEGSSPYGGGWFAASYPAPVRSFIFHQDPVAALAHPFLDAWISRPRLDGLARPLWSYLSRLGGRFDTTVVAGRWLAARLEAFGLPRVTAVPFGIDPAPFLEARSAPELRAEWRARLGLPEGGALLVAVSRHHPEKRLATVIAAVRSLTDVGLVVFGDGPARKSVERAVGGCPRIHLAGYVRDRPSLARALASADGLVHGSAAETFGLVLSEALAAGCPLIAPSEGGAGELVRPEFGETYAAGDAEACADAIRRLLARRGAAKAGAEAIRTQQRTLEAHFHDLFAHYAALLAASRPHC